jgi:hypothetical protein
MIPSTVVGTVEGTGAAINVVVGFKPDYVKIANTEDGDTIDEWFRGMAAGTSITNTSAAVATRAANGITAYEGTEGEGFTIGSGISENGKTLYYLAIRSGPGAS